MLNTILYPCNINSVTIYNNQKMLGDININKLVSPKGSGIGNRDASYLLRCSNNVGLIIQEDINSFLEECDAIIITDGLSNNQEYIDIINDCNRLGKRVILSRQVSSLLNKHNDFTIKNTNYSNCQLMKEFLEYHNKLKNQLYDIETPIISVIGDGDSYLNFDIEMKFCSHCQKNDYNFSYLSSHSYSNIFGFICINDVIDLGSTFIEKVMITNHFVYFMEQKFASDVFIIGYPNPILPNNKYDIESGFGENSYIIGSALHSDVALLNLHYINGLNNDYVDKMSMLAYYRYNCMCQYSIINNMILVPDEYDENHFDNAYINYNEMDLSMCGSNTVTKYNGFDKILQDIFQQLEHGIDII